MSDEIRPIPVEKFATSDFTISRLNDQISEAVNSLDPNQKFAVIGVGTLKRQELVAVARINDKWSFAGFIKHEKKIDLGIMVRFAT